MQPGDDLLDVERLGHVVVAADAEAAQPVGERIACGQEQHRRVDALRAQRLADVAAVGVGQADVDHERVGRVVPVPRSSSSRPLATARAANPSARRLRTSTSRSGASSSTISRVGSIFTPQVSRGGPSAGAQPFRR